MSPQLSTQQLEHAIGNLEKLLSAKKLEIYSLSAFKENAPVAVIQLLGADPLGQSLRDATENFFASKLNRALIELEEMEMQMKALRHMRSGVVIPGMQVGRQ